LSPGIRPAQLKDLAAIEAVYRQHAHESSGPGHHESGAALKRQFASTRLWFLLNNTLASILPITSAADYVYVSEAPNSGGIQGFVQAEATPAGRHVWQILNLCLRPDLDRFKAGTALLDHLFNEGLSRGVSKFVVRVPVGDPTAELFAARGFESYATEHALLAESLKPRPMPELSGWRAMRRDDQLALYLLYRAVTPRKVSAVEAATFKEWRHSFQQGAWTGDAPRSIRQRQFVVDRVEVVAWMGVSVGSGGRPHTLGLMAQPQPADLWPDLVQRAAAYLAQHRPGPVWCSLRHYDEAAIKLLQREGFEVIASQMLMVKELALKVPARVKVRVKDKRLVPQYG
jgi:ribosomal protein S18 acetylase RimI-like enzyme